MVENFKRCTIQSNEQVDEIIDSEEHVVARSWLRKDSTEQVDVLSDSKKLVVAGSDPKSDPSSNLNVATHTINRISSKTLLINPTIQVVVGPITPLITAGVVGAQ